MIEYNIVNERIYRISSLFLEIYIYIYTYGKIHASQEDDDEFAECFIQIKCVNFHNKMFQVKVCRVAKIHRNHSQEK